MFCICSFFLLTSHTPFSSRASRYPRDLQTAPAPAGSATAQRAPLANRPVPRTRVLPVVVFFLSNSPRNRAVQRGTSPMRLRIYSADLGRNRYGPAEGDKTSTEASFAFRPAATDQR